MKLPNAESAIIAIEKLRNYCLDPEHPRGKHKARVFSSVLGDHPRRRGNSAGGNRESSP
jgi:hypothetical protein